jgi:DNA-binding transcriptional MerR regulator
MRLKPKLPPGRADRKAADYALEIVHLRADGYTFEVIRQALSDVGIELSTSALRREIRRHQRQHQQQHQANDKSLSMRSALPAPKNATQSPQPQIHPMAGATGREIAEAFFNAHPSNPLLRTKDTP